MNLLNTEAHVGLQLLHTTRQTQQQGMIVRRHWVLKDKTPLRVDVIKYKISCFQAFIMKKNLLSTITILCFFEHKNEDFILLSEEAPA